MAPALVLQLGNEESEVLVPGSEEQLELEEVEGEELKGDGRDERHKVLSPPLSTSAKTGTGIYTDWCWCTNSSFVMWCNIIMNLLTVCRWVAW